MLPKYDLERFVEKQKLFFPTALKEIRNGHKKSHWMWFIFPQLKCLGKSANSIYYGIDGLGEAKAYIEHPYLRENLITISKALNELEECNIYKVMEGIDGTKLQSCMTLFHIAAPDIEVFSDVLRHYFHSRMDQKTINYIKNEY